MVYQIYYLPKGSKDGERGYVMFDIEYYMEEACDNISWFSEIHCLPCVAGLTHFLNDNLTENCDIETFIKDSEKIQEIRGLLYENYNNKPKSMDDASNFHYHVFGKLLREMLDKYCERYHLYLNID